MGLIKDDRENYLKILFWSSHNTIKTQYKVIAISAIIYVTLCQVHQLLTSCLTGFQDISAAPNKETISVSMAVSLNVR